MCSKSRLRSLITFAFSTNFPFSLPYYTETKTDFNWLRAQLGFDKNVGFIAITGTKRKSMRYKMFAPTKY